MNLPSLKLLAPLLVLTIFTSCLNLKKVSDYSTKSLATLTKFEEVGTSFAEACNTKCKIGQLEKQQLFSEPCNCKANEDADSVTLILYNAINGYFEGLVKLSDNELTNYKFDTAALNEGSFGDITITREHAESYGKIATVLLRAVTDGYRKKKIATYVGEANSSIQNLISAFDFTLEANLSKKLEVQKGIYQSYYFDLLKNTGTSVYEKKKIIEEYDIVMAGIASKQKQIAVYGKGLRKIAAGHQKLYDYRNTLSANNLKESLAQYAGALQAIKAEFNKLKNQD